MEHAQITGVDDCMRCLNALPANAVKVSKTAMRDASKATSKKVRAATPKRWRYLMRYKVFKGATGNLSARVGLYNGHQRKGHTDVDDWFKAYWANYGTLMYRDPNHHFKNKVKQNMERWRKNNRGQKAEHFFENATAGWEDVFFDTFEESMKKHEDELYDR